MKLSAKTITGININTKFKFHPLAKKLYNLINEAYLLGGQAEYLKEINDLFICYESLPIHQIAIISSGTNEYQIIGGCFTPFFNIKELNNDNSIFLSYKSSKKDVKPEHQKHVAEEFKQDVIDFIYMDFIRAISLTSLAKPGAMYPKLRQVTQEFDSQVWQGIFGEGSRSSKDYLRQTDFAKLLDKSRFTIGKQIHKNEKQNA